MIEIDWSPLTARKSPFALRPVYAVNSNTWSPADRSNGWIATESLVVTYTRSRRAPPPESLITATSQKSALEVALFFDHVSVLAFEARATVLPSVVDRLTPSNMIPDGNATFEVTLYVEPWPNVTI